MKNLRTLLPISMLMLSLLLLACGNRREPNTRDGMGKTSANSGLPEMTLRGINGEIVKASELKGKKVFVNLWATWCGPCVAEMPSIEKLYQQTKSDQVAFVLISVDKSFDKAIAFARQRNLTVPIYQVVGDLPDLFNVPGIPATFIFNGDGKITFNQIGSTDYSKAKYVNMLK